MKQVQVTHCKTADGSSTLCSAKYGVHYHSLNGAVTESEHIFINAGLSALDLKEINILEIGFGTGLNVALTANYSKINGIKVNYCSLELFPLTTSEYELLNYPQVLPTQAADFWKTICELPWNERKTVFENFYLEKLHVDFTAWNPTNKYHLVYFDAFAPNDQPEMWEEKQFQKLFNAMHPNSILVTYCVKGIVKNALSNADFSLERLPGPPGKRHMLRARKMKGY